MATITDPTNPELIDSDAAFDISESLVPVRDRKTAGHSTISFGGLLKEPLLLKEDLKEGCGGQLWPAGMVLARYLLRQRRSDLVDKQIVELGAGGGLVGLAVALGQRDAESHPRTDETKDAGPSPIYITDQSPMLPLMETNIELNGLSSSVKASVLDWGEPLPTAIPTHPSIILAADCVYFEPAFPLLISTLKDLMGPESVCYFCYKKRRRADIRFMKSAKKIFDIEEIRDDPDAETYSRENIFLYRFRLKHRKTAGSGNA
ncbi:putative methyltransferase-domain-containing protein [Aspergillus ambiguus]|uniref:putative methyltransferase-domain-containing protein n=1 Tax=Aspergillus ambiguus TaxID=176160 RepID=UPI003CCD564D